MSNLIATDLTLAALLASFLDQQATTMTSAELDRRFGTAWRAAAQHLLSLGLIHCYTRGSGTDGDNNDMTTVYSVRGLKRGWRQAAPAQGPLRSNPSLRPINEAAA